MPDSSDSERWVETMPVLAGILRRERRPRCCLHPDAEPDEIREVEWGKLVRHGDHYTLCEDPERLIAVTPLGDYDFGAVLERESERAGTMNEIVIIGADDHEFDPEEEDGPRLAVGLLGAEVRDRWVCSGCHNPGGTIYVERYDKSGGSTFALCSTCAFEQLVPRGPASSREATDG